MITVTGMAFSPDGQILALGVGESVQLWQIADDVFLSTPNSLVDSVENEALFLSGEAVLQLIVIYFTPWGETNDRLLPASTTHDS